MALRAEGLPRRNRFTEQGSFAPVLRAPRKIRGRHAVIHVMPAREDVSRLGIALTRRLVPSAVARNRLKRLLRETFRRHPVKTVGLDCVITLREFPGVQGEADLVTEVRSFFDQLQAAP